MSNWQKQKIEASRAFQSRAYEAVNKLLFKKREGRCLTLANDSKLVEFVSCSYLGLDLEPRIIHAAVQNLAHCGLTFPAARTRIQAESFPKLEALLNQIFCDGRSTVFSTVHLGHLAILPMLGSGELPSFPIAANGINFILDKSVHASVQINRALMQQFGTVTLVDFNNHHALADRFCRAAQQKQTPVAIADGIGSMGGLAPVNTLFELADTHNGYVYLDDAHGTSICGRHGCGYVLECLNHHFHPRLMLAASLAKAFGSIAGVIVLPTADDAEMLHRYAEPYAFSGPPALPMIDAAIASARIHLTDEITILQNKLQANLRYFDTQLNDRHTVINRGTISPVRGTSS